MDRIVNGMYGAKGSSKETHKSFPIIKGYGGRILKRILKYYSKYYEVNLCHSDIKNNVSYEKWYK